VYVEHVAQHREQVLLDAADHAAVDEGAGRGIAQVELDAPGLALDVDVEVVVALEDGTRVVGLAAAVQHRERTAAEQVVEAATRRVEQAVHLLLREVLEAAGRRHPRVDEVLLVRGRNRHLDVAHHGRISIGMPRRVRCQMSTIAEFDTAMQPSVQSLLA